MVQENGFAYIRPGEETDNNDKNAELLRAVEACGVNFVERVRNKYRDIALNHMAAEKTVCGL